jgi:hypothetical protein
MSLSHVTITSCDMPRSEIPVDVLLYILDYVDIADLATICRVNKICCSCTQDVLYRDISDGDLRIQQTLAQSTHLAKKARSFQSWCVGSGLAMALRNMTSLRILKLSCDFHMDILDGCTFKLDSFECTHLVDYGESLPKFLSSQPSLKNVKLPIDIYYPVSSPFEATCLPNLTRINAEFPWLPYLIPGRPLDKVISRGCTWNENSIHLSFFALSTTPIQKLMIDYSYIHSTPGHLLASFLPSLKHFTLSFERHYTSLDSNQVCGLPLY